MNELFIKLPIYTHTHTYIDIEFFKNELTILKRSITLIKFNIK
jgi:hypothetical protein